MEKVKGHRGGGGSWGRQYVWLLPLRVSPIVVLYGGISSLMGVGGSTLMVVTSRTIV